jgi:hypothetical protein
VNKPGRGIKTKNHYTLKGVYIMKNISDSNDNRVGMIIDRIEDLFMTVSGIAIGLSPLLAFM